MVLQGIDISSTICKLILIYIKNIFFHIGIISYASIYVNICSDVLQKNLRVWLITKVTRIRRAVIQLQIQAEGCENGTDHIHICRILSCSYAEYILLVRRMEKHDCTAVTVFQAVGNAGNPIDGNQAVNLIATLPDCSCKIINGFGTVTVGPYYRKCRCSF